LLLLRLHSKIGLPQLASNLLIPKLDCLSLQATFLIASFSFLDKH
jgi:hypothetical protein